MASIAPACSEHELITAARDGSDLAFEELYSRYRERIGAFILSRVRDHGRAEDIAQEVFISALRRLRASEQAIAFKPWIYEIAKNACIDEFRRSRRTREVSLDADDGLTGGPRALRSVAPTPPAAVESKQRLDDLRGAFGGLSDNHHQLLVMREFEGLSYEEIGARTGMSRATVESSLFRARRKLTAEYDELASGRRCEQVQSAIEDGRALSARSFGLRERRRMTRHLAHCQPCRVKAHLAGVDESLVSPRSVGAKIAALLPIPLWRWPWRGGIQSVAASAEPAAATTSLGGAAVAAVALAIAGVGGGVIAGLPGHGRYVPATARRAAAGTRVTGPGAPASSFAVQAARSRPQESRSGAARAASLGSPQRLSHFRRLSGHGPSAAASSTPTRPGAGSANRLPASHGLPPLAPAGATVGAPVPGAPGTSLPGTLSSVLSRPVGSGAPPATSSSPALLSGATSTATPLKQRTTGSVASTGQGATGTAVSTAHQTIKTVASTVSTAAS